jgi:hypothetical protein
MGKASAIIARTVTVRSGEGQPMTQLYHCPVCGNVSDVAGNCGECLMERLKIVRLVPIQVTDCPGLMVPDLTNVVLFRRPRP